MAVPPDRLHLLTNPHALAVLDGLLGRYRKRLPRHVDLDGLRVAALGGLARAAILWDPARGVPFHVYARPRLLGAMRDELRTGDWVPRPVREERKAAGLDPVHVQSADAMAGLAEEWGERGMDPANLYRPCGAPTPDTRDPAHLVEQRDALEWGLGLLPATVRQLLRDVYLAHPPIPMGDLARRDGVSLSALSLRVKQAREDLRRMLVLRFGRNGVL